MDITNKTVLPIAGTVPSLRRGLEALHRGDHLAAMAQFEALLRRARQHPNHSDEASALSYYGLALALHSPARREALGFCERAALIEFYNPDLYLNLAQVCLVLGDRRRAYDSIQRGLSLRPTHPGLKHALSVVGQRRKPLLPFLTRSHPINVTLGRWLRRLFGL